MKGPTFTFTAVLAFCVPALGDGFTYLDFADPQRLVFQADASPSNGLCRLTPPAKGKVGGIWFGEMLAVSGGFESTFQFQLTEPFVYGADGMAFVVQKNPTPSVGKPGWQMGFGGISNSLVVKFDNYHWRDKVYQKYDEVAVSVCGGSGDCDPDTNYVATATRDVRFSDGKIHTAKVAYSSGTIRVYLDDFRQPVLQTPLQLPAAFEVAGAQAWVGFTAATGNDFQAHDLLNWNFASSTLERFPPVAAIRGGPWSPGIQAQTAVPAPDQGAKAAESAPVVPTTSGVHAPVPMAVPRAMTARWRIEASTNLADWVSVTNIAVYFSDPESTNFNQRFYRILEQ
jgi:hypothetical protein